MQLIGLLGATLNPPSSQYAIGLFGVLPFGKEPPIALSSEADPALRTSQNVTNGTGLVGSIQFHESAIEAQSDIGVRLNSYSGEPPQRFVGTTSVQLRRERVSWLLRDTE